MKAENIRVEGLNDKEARKLLIKIASEMKWRWWFDNEGKLIIDVDGSLDLRDN